jgi:hypothetical protein
MNEVNQFIDELKTISELVEKEFGRMKPRELNWRSSDEEWSIAQCLEHLILINSSYFPLIEKLAREGYRPSRKERLPLLPKLFGRMILHAVRPRGGRKYKTTDKFKPNRADIDSQIVTKFITHQKELLAHIESIRGLDLKNTIITSPVVGFATYSLFDTLKILVSHEKRHLEQAERVMLSENFPDINST